MGVAKRRVGQKQRLLGRAPSAKRRRPPSPEIAGESRPAARPASRTGAARGSGAIACTRRPRDPRKAVDRDLGRIGQKPHRPVLPDREPEQLGVLVDKPGRAVARQKLGVRDHVEQERNVRLHPPHPKLLERPLHPPGRVDEPPARGTDLHQQRVVERRDDPAGDRPARRRSGCPARQPSDSG